MNNYNFSTLNDKEFEQLAKDLLNAKYDLDLQNFKVGKDKGIDLRYSTSQNNNSIVVQVKHYVSSSFNQLKDTFERKELEKIKTLKPNRYIIVTSLPLSAYQKDTLKKLLQPFILKSSDIFGQEDLNGFLSEFKEIETKYYKLWFSSINIFNSVLNNAIEGRTKYMLQSIQKKISFYVLTKNFHDAIKILLQQKILLITGQPGIGKTTLAEIILFDRAKNGCKIHKVENISEAENVISVSDEEKQLFYFDDFLGANYLEIVNAHKTETQITSFVERIKNSPNKYLVLTTRTIILNQAKERYEKFGRLVHAQNQFEIKLNDYSDREKALILYNHLYFRKIKEELYEYILSRKIYWIIIKHGNYTPRIIEFLTDNSRIETLTPNEFAQFVLNNLNKPDEIWRHSFNNQIDYFDRCLLITLFTFPNGVQGSMLVKAYSERLKYEKSEHNQTISVNQFQDSVKVLLNGFIISTISDTNALTRNYKFINPSLTDFLIGYVANSFLERKSIISSIVYPEQLIRFNPGDKIIPLEQELQQIFKNRLTKIMPSLSGNNAITYVMWLLCKYCIEINIDELLLKLFKRVSYNGSWGSIYTTIEYFLNQLNEKPKTLEYVEEHFIKIMEKIMPCISLYHKAVLVPKMFDKFQHDYNLYLKSKNGAHNIAGIIKRVLDAEIEAIESDASEFTDLNAVERRYEAVSETEYNLLSKLLPSNANRIDVFIDVDLDMDNDYWEEKINENKQRIDNEDEMEYYYRSKHSNIDTTKKSYNDKEYIDELFRKSE